jgi:hypothetical protein
MIQKYPTLRIEQYSTTTRRLKQTFRQVNQPQRGFFLFGLVIGHQTTDLVLPLDLLVIQVFTPKQRERFAFFALN